MGRDRLAATKGVRAELARDGSRTIGAYGRIFEGCVVQHPQSSAWHGQHKHSRSRE
ncbi:hypothetical protein CHELA40_12173 [Chelatococcus asaccharovorans]|nr:hypothetical protein CHELA40_12173 [Chelatococcus asaccharovorans]CAH1683303.1 hypothetical protein CHELA17_63433 [Chelatococcus asaccharovorans]